MPGYVRSGGSWRFVTSLQVKRPSGWTRATSGWVNNGSQWVRFFTSGIQDTFNRANGSLGTTSDGSATWSVTRGAWTINSNVATSSTAASSYPLAVVALGQAGALVQADTPVAGSGIAFGVVDMNNWYGAFITRRTGTYSCNPYSCNCTCTQSVCNSCTVCVAQPCVDTCKTCTYQTCSIQKKSESYNYAQYKCTTSGWTFDTYVSAGCSCCTCSCTPGTIAFTCNSSNRGSVTSVINCLGTSGCGTGSCGCASYTSTTGASCAECGSECVAQPCVNTSFTNDCANCGSTCTQTSCDTCHQSCTGYYYGIRLVRCVAGTVTELGITEGILNGFQPLSIRVVSTASGITAAAYSGTGQTGGYFQVTSQLVPTGASQGILIGPSAVSQGNTVDNFYTEVQ